MKLLITGFEPFGGEAQNPSWEAVCALPDRHSGFCIIKQKLPTAFQTAGKLLCEAICAKQPDVVLCVGQAGGRSGITVERIAVNLADFSASDNEGNQPVDQPICPGAENAYFSNLPVKRIVEKIRERGIPASLSLTAGTFVCNEVMYRLLHLAATKYPHLKGGFLHVPYAPQQAVQKGANTPSMSVSVITEALLAAVEALAEDAE